MLVDVSRSSAGFERFGIMWTSKPNHIIALDIALGVNESTSDSIEESDENHKATCL